MRDTQEKFTTALEKIAEDFGLELVDDGNWANTGTLRLEARDGFAPVVKMSYSFQRGYASFDELLPADLGDRDKMLRDLPDGPITKRGTHFPYVLPEELEERVLSAVRRCLVAWSVDHPRPAPLVFSPTTD